ncbi:sulfatase-like hydrolase/transferase [Mycobacterium spongiae]|uniref:Sulfatase-like hydrolase/transferase n=2 Tax=Mycobacterium spongiae TaxID=886343 RepID=A0A975K256_9MYCO|nr:sulfatase-like hydrolase/transferase [Mycobacterium spongiae]
MDNLGYGELGCYGGGEIRGAATPRLDELAAQGLRLTNFNVEAQCTPSRAALMTGRHAIRTGNATVPIDSPVYGLVQWEYTMAEMFADIGYRTALFGKWHLGHTEGRFPTDQGFDEWYGIPNSSDESFWPDSSVFREGVTPFVRPEHVMAGVKGQQPENVKIYNLEARRMIDREITDKTIEFIDRQVAADTPFFVYVPYTMVHAPMLLDPEFDGASGNGQWGDILTQVDTYTGRILDKLDELGIADDTIVIFTSDNGPEGKAPYEGFGGPWRGPYFTALEGSLRVPFIMRWRDRIPAGRVSNEIVHQVDLITTLASMLGGEMPTDRVIDGVDHADFFEGRTSSSAREGFVVYVGAEIYGIKWRNWKAMYKELDAGRSAVKTFATPVLYNLHEDPREERPERHLVEAAWVRFPAFEVLKEHLASFAHEPPVPKGAPDPYVPANARPK